VPQAIRDVDAVNKRGPLGLHIANNITQKKEKR
jgi:hypothetical protein